MSRTVRRLYIGSKSTLKWFNSGFEWLTIVHLHKFRRQMRGARYGWLDDEQIENNKLVDAHAWRYRNDSCRRHRIHGVALTKRLAARGTRARENAHLRAMVRTMVVDDLTREMIISRNGTVGKFRGEGETNARFRSASYGYEDDVMPSLPNCVQESSR